MLDNGIAVLQRQDSPYTLLVKEALHNLGVGLVYLSAPPKEINPDPFTPRMMIWDLSGYSAVQKIKTAGELKEMHHGLVILADQPGVVDTEVFALPGALAWLAHPRTPGELSVAIQVANSLYERHTAVLKQLEHTRFELTTRSLLDRAKRIVMMTEKLEEKKAMEKLQDCSRNLNRRMLVTVREILHLGGFAKLCQACKIGSCPHHPPGQPKS